jgi:hypothetical protein
MLTLAFQASMTRSSSGIDLGLPRSIWPIPNAVCEQKASTKRFGEACRRYMDRVPQMNAILGIIRHVGCPTPGEDEREDGMCETILVGHLA